MTEPQITFGMIVLNGEPFIKYNLRSLYPFAHQIIVVEGAAPGAKNIASPDGHSTDSTLATLREFKQTEDPQNKLIIVTAEDEGYENGFWLGEKDEQSRAYAKRATGDYLWQVDADEFYKPEDIQKIISMLEADSSITAVSFPMITFWGGLSYWADGWYLRRGAAEFHRLFKWGARYSYVTHRPPTVYDPRGINVRNIKWVRRKDLLHAGIYMYHYSLLLPRQVYEKCNYYSEAEWAKRSRALLWADENFMALKHPYHVHNVYDYPSWLNRFTGSHPPQVVKMIEDIENRKIKEPMREMNDAEKLLSFPWYTLGRTLLILLDYPDRLFRIFRSRRSMRLFAERAIKPRWRTLRGFFYRMIGRS